MDYDDIDYDEGYSMIDIDNNWSNSNMEYDETDFDSDSDMDNYNYNDNSSTNNWSILTGDKINQQTNKHNDSFLDRINKKLESLEATERSVIVERKNDSSVERKMIAFWTSMKLGQHIFWSLSTIGVVSLNTTSIQEILIYHLMIQVLWLKNGLISCVTRFIKCRTN